MAIPYHRHLCPLCQSNPLHALALSVSMLSLISFLSLPMWSVPTFWADKYPCLPMYRPPFLLVHWHLQRGIVSGRLAYPMSIPPHSLPTATYWSCLTLSFSVMVPSRALQKNGVIIFVALFIPPCLCRFSFIKSLFSPVHFPPPTHQQKPFSSHHRPPPHHTTPPHTTPHPFVSNSIHLDPHHSPYDPLNQHIHAHTP